MAKIRVLSAEAEARLRSELSSEQRLDAYRNASACSFLADSDFLDTPLELQTETPSLVTPTDPQNPIATRPETDAANAEAVYLHIGPIRPVYASDRRLWSALTHTSFWAYSRWRYPKIPKTEASTYLKEHWFVAGAGLASLRRNAVARLWWAAHLTVKPLDQDDELKKRFSKPDRFHFTKVLLSSQQVYQDVMERDFGSSDRLRFCFLDAFDQFRNAVSSPDQLMKRAVTRLNLRLGYQHLITVPLATAHEEIIQLVERAANELSAGKAPVPESSTDEVTEE